MQPDLAVHPDEVVAVIDFLEASTRLSEFDVHVAGDLKGWHAPEKWIIVQTTGGSFEGKRTAISQLDLNVYAPSKPLAAKIARTAAADLRSMANYTTSDIVIIRAEPSWPADITDPINSNPRYVFDLNLWIRPN
ncbi:MAG: hypothetical protein ABW007_11370 [Chitinophagaceae bacterium]